MANISNEVKVHDGSTVTNWISQINAGGTVYDIATHHGITFKDGSADTTGVTWNGLTDLVVTIPSIEDIVQTPIEFAGTVGADGTITWTDGRTKAEKGSLVFVTADCTFAGQACEAGDMAIYDGNKWNVVAGENQVQLVGTVKDNKVTVAVGAAQDVLTVEGKTLTLTLDYAEIDKHITTTPGGTETVVFGDITIDSVGLKLNKGTDVTKTISKDTVIKNATKLASGIVTLTNADSLVSSVDFGTFNAGTLPTFTRNTEKTFAVTGGVLKTQEVGSDFITSVAIKDIAFVEAGEGDTNKIKVVKDITSKTGAEFLNGIHTTGTGETADITISGGYVPTEGVDTTFVEGLVGDLSPVTSISAGSIKLISGTDFVTGFGTENATSGDVVSSVTVTANNDTSVLNNAKVENHVLSFDSTNVTSGVTTTLGYKSLTRGAYEYTAPVATTTEFVKSGFTKSDDVKYTFNKGNETIYEPVTEMWKISAPTIAVTKGGYTIDHTNMIATVPAGTFIESATEGTLPTWEGYSAPTVTVTGTVGTTLTTSDVTIKELTVDTIALPGDYTLTTATTGADVEVAAAGKTIEIGTSTVDLSGYIKDVTIS